MKSAGREIIEQACGRIMMALKEATFTREDLEFLVKFFREIADVSEKKLHPPNKPMERTDEAALSPQDNRK